MSSWIAMRLGGVTLSPPTGFPGVPFSQWSHWWVGFVEPFLRPPGRCRTCRDCVDGDGPVGEP